MRGILLGPAMVLLCVALAPGADAHFVKVDSCSDDPALIWDDPSAINVQNLLSPDPSAIVVIHLPCGLLYCADPDVCCSTNLDPVFACKPHP
jgi:hypothetical protein